MTVIGGGRQYENRRPSNNRGAQALESGVHPTSKTGHMVESDSGGAKEKWEYPGMRGLEEIERDDNYRCISVTTY